MEFYGKPEYWKSALGAYPRYFVHFRNGDTDVFGLSKFIAFRDISLEDYLTKYRYETNGGKTQRYISRLTGKKWKTRNQIDKKTREAFDEWISEFFPKYSLDNASFISLETLQKLEKKKSVFVSPEKLQQQLKLQEEIGQSGEIIAIEFEMKRLKGAGMKNADDCIEHVSQRNSAAGFDILSSHRKETRYIEVKASLNNNQDFFITENEVHVLRSFGEKAFLYLVHVENLKEKRGQVINVIRNPIRQLKLKPVAYKGSGRNIPESK